ncbi:hypothetical protein Tsp_00850 [Trichinella spiralis]|nr:hypothetical protein Tsp_00850 [Trichinella spiralis]
MAYSTVDQIRDALNSLKDFIEGADSDQAEDCVQQIFEHFRKLNGSERNFGSNSIITFWQNIILKNCFTGFCFNSLLSNDSNSLLSILSSSIGKTAFAQTIGYGIDIIRLAIAKTTSLSPSHRKAIMRFTLRLLKLDYLKGRREHVLYLVHEYFCNQFDEVFSNTSGIREISMISKSYGRLFQHLFLSIQISYGKSSDAQQQKVYHITNILETASRGLICLIFQSLIRVIASLPSVGKESIVLPKDENAFYLADYLPFWKMLLDSEFVDSSLKLGLNYLPIACVCLDALEKWSAEFPEDEPQLDSFYTDLLPIFDDYLRCTSVDETLVSNNGFNYNGEKSTLFNRKRNSGNVFDKGDDNDSEEEIPNPQTVLRRIASFVGSLGCYMNRFLINSADAGSLLRWGQGSHLEFICPFPDMKFEIALGMRLVIYDYYSLFFSLSPNLDTLLPRLCDLALSAGDRPLKVAACEALHACVLFLLGNESFRTVKVKDRVPKQMFSTLFVQILHLFSGTDFADKIVTSCLLDTLMDGLCCFWNSSLRDQSAYYISEYCRWSMRRVDNAGQNMHGESKVELLVQTIITFAVHSSAVKRAGAAVAFNNLYKIIREKRWLVDIYILEMFFTFMKSLYLAENDDELYGTVDECKQAIKHIRRIILYNLNMLRIHNERRRTPNEWSQSTIHCCCDWLLNTMTWSNYQFRSECFVSYQELTNAEIEKLHFLRHIGTSIFGLIDHFERSHRSVLGSFSICNLQDRVATGTSIYALVLWLETYEAMIDGYVWALNTNRISMEDWNDYLLSKNKKSISISFQFHLNTFRRTSSNEESTVSMQHGFGEQYCNWAKFSQYFKNAKKSIEQVKNLLLIVVLINTQKYLFHRTRCKCFVALCKLIAALVNCPNLNNFQGFLKLLLYPNTWNAFLKVACDPKSLGFRLYSKQLFECISQDVRLLFLALKDNTFLVQQVSTSMKEYLTQYNVFFLHCSLIINIIMVLFIRFYPWPDVKSVVTCDSHLAIEQQQLLNVYGMLVEVGLQCVVELPGAEFLWTTVADVYFSKRIGLPPSKLGMVKQIFRVAALTGSAVDVLIKLLMNAESVRLAECSTLCSTKGELLIANFSEEIALLLCTNAELFLKHLKEASRCQPDVVGRALLHTVTVVVHSSDLRKKHGRDLALQVLQIFGQELLYWADVAVSNETLKLLWLKLIMKLILIDSKITEWEEFAPMASAYFMMLNDQSLTLDFKNNMLSLLAGFCTFDKHASELGKSLKLFMVNNFPLKSDEFAKGTAKYDQYVAACQKILFAFGCTGSPVILELLLSMICREQSHPIASDLKHQLQKFSSRASRVVLENILVLLDEMFFNPSSCVCASLRLALLNEFFIPFLHSLNSDLLLSWTCRRIQTLVSCLTESSISEIKTDYEEQVITKIGCYKIFEIIYKVLDLEFLKTEVNSSYLGSDGQMKNELIKKLASCAVGAKKEFCRDSKLGSIQRYFFEYRCAAQNCIIALVKKTQSHLKHYEGFVFNDCWESIIDNEVKYEFDREIQEEEVFLSVCYSQSAGKMYYSREEKPPSAESENQVELSVLLDSSLSAMATQFDLTESLEASIHCAEKETVSANDKDVFRPFYLEWISPIIKLIVMDEFGSNILHYFRVDLIVVLFEWTAHLKKHCCSKSGKVFKRNLRIIETMLVLWKPWILEKICFPLHDEMENLCGISILCLCLNTVPETFSFLTDPNHESGFFNDLLDWFPSVQGDLKTACLEGFLAVSKYKGDLFEELKSRGFLKIFSLRHERDQMLGMYIVKNIHANLSVENVSDLVSSFSSAVVGNFSPSCRRAFAEMCCSLYTKLSSLNDSSENSKTALATTKMHLLTMLSDSNKSIRQLVYNFWCDESRLEISTSARLLNCLSQLYTCATESTFLSHASYVMLELTCHSPDYTRPIYDHPLEDCTFENLPISTHWQSRYASLEVPAYMQTDTHSVQQAKNVSADTFELDFDESDSSDNLTVILDKILQDIKKPKSSSVKKVDDLDGDLQFLKNRILKDTEEKAFFVNLDRKRQKVIERLKQQSLDLRGKYRSGDFPDIQIPYSAVIITLQAVAELDKVFAGQLFESLMYGVVAHVIESCGFEVTEKYFNSINDGVREIFRSMVTFHRPLVSCLMNFLYNFIEYVDFEPTDIANVAIGSGQPDCGIVLLERRIEVAVEDTTASTSHEWRPKHVNEIDQLWVELARLYKQCGELENLRAVFTKHLLTAEETKLALEMEAAGDFEGAAAIYGECLEMLNDWKGLEAWSTTFGSTGQTTKLDQIWETDYLINMHLPVFLRSKLKIALTSDSVALEELSTFVEQNQSVPKNREILEVRTITTAVHFIQYKNVLYLESTFRISFNGFISENEFKLENVVKLCRFWLRYGLDVETTLTTTADDVVLNRKTFLEIFGKRLVDSGISVSNVRQSLLPFRLQFGYQYLKCAVRQNNHGVVFSLLSSIKKLLQRLQDKHLLLEASNYETWALLQLANCANAVKSRSAYLMQALNLFDLKKITDPELNTTEGSSADQFALIGMLFDNVAETVVASSENTLAEFCLSRLISNTDTADISEIDSVPSWMFLSWLNQMLSALKRSNKFYSILERIADDYPQHVIDELESIIMNISNKSNEARRETMVKLYSFVTFADIRREFVGSFWKCFFQNYLRMCSSILSELRTFYIPECCPNNLNEYSPWLTAYRPHPLDVFLEIPALLHLSLLNLCYCQFLIGSSFLLQ